MRAIALELRRKAVEELKWEPFDEKNEKGGYVDAKTTE
jgi:hypothetical protein